LPLAWLGRRQGEEDYSVGLSGPLTSASASPRSALRSWSRPRLQAGPGELLQTGDDDIEQLLILASHRERTLSARVAHRKEAAGVLQICSCNSVALFLKLLGLSP